MDVYLSNKMPPRGKRAASESGAPSGGLSECTTQEFGNLVFSIREQGGGQTSAPTGRNPYSPGQRPGGIKTDIQRALKGRHNLYQPKSCLGLLYSALTGLNRRPIRSGSVCPWLHGSCPVGAKGMNKMPLRGKRAASESGAPSGGPFLMRYFEIRKLCFSDTLK